MSALDGLVRFGVAAMQGYQGEVKALEEKKRQEENRALELQRQRQQDQRLNAQELRSQQSHDLNMRQTQANIERSKIIQGREDEEYNRKRTLESGLGQAQAFAEAGDAAGVFGALESTSNAILDVKIKFDRDETGKIIVDKEGKAIGQRFTKDGIPLGDKQQYDMQKSTQAIAALSDASSYWKAKEQLRQELDREARTDKRSRSNFLFENRITRQQKLEDEQRQESQSYRAKVADNVIDLMFKEPKTTSSSTGSAVSGGFDSKGNVVGSALDPSLGVAVTPQVASSLDVGLQRAKQIMQAMPQLFQGNPYLQKLVEANIAVESGGDPAAQSPAGALGLMQIMPIARKDVMQRGAPDPYASPQNNIIGGAVQLNRLIEKYDGDLTKVFAANNWGEGNLDKLIKANPNNWQQGLPTETKTHLAKLDYALQANGLSLSSATKAQQQQTSQVRQAKRVQSANMATAKIPDVAKRVTDELGIGKSTSRRGSQVTGADVNARLTKAVEYLSDMQTMPAGTNEVKRYEKFRKAAEEVAQVVPETLGERRSDYILGVIAQLVNARSIEEMRQQLKLVNPEAKANAGQAPAASTPQQTLAAIQRSKAPMVDNPVAPTQEQVPFTEQELQAGMAALLNSGNPAPQAASAGGSGAAAQPKPQPKPAQPKPEAMASNERTRQVQQQNAALQRRALAMVAEQQRIEEQRQYELAKQEIENQRKRMEAIQATRSALIAPNANKWVMN